MVGSKMEKWVKWPFWGPLLAQKSEFCQIKDVHLDLCLSSSTHSRIYFANLAKYVLHMQKMCSKNSEKNHDHFFVEDNQVPNVHEDDR